MKNVVIRYILRRLTEASTIRGLVLGIGAAAGLIFSPEQTDALVWIVLGLVALIGTFFPDHMPTPDKRTSSDKIEEREDTVTVLRRSLDRPSKPHYRVEEFGFGDK
jgi:hypothetical protein